ncbi:D123-domain-containing protein [Meredithblackwellia eburnea MCA 4105]
MTLPFPRLQTRDILECEFKSWYPTFRRHSPKATIIDPLPQEFIHFLEMDGLVMPEDSGPMGQLSDSEDSDSNPGSDSDSSQAPLPSFPELTTQLHLILKSYDSSVFPKLNSSAPVDAAWMLPGSNLKCQTPGDVYLLLKSSDFVMRELEVGRERWGNCTDWPAVVIEGRGVEGAEEPQHPPGFSHHLIVKKYFEMPPSQEWRCFIRDRCLVAMCQRDPNYYEFLQESKFQEEIKSHTIKFWEEVVRDQFPLSNYTMDIYFTRTHSRIFIIDFNPFSPVHTDPLLFSWEDVLSLPVEEARGPVMGIVRDRTIGNGMMNFSHNRYPREVVELSDGRSIAEL